MFSKKMGDHGSNNFFGGLPPTISDDWQWQSVLMRFVFRPRHEIMQHIAKIKEDLGWPDGDVIGVHVRQGDKYASAPVSVSRLWDSIFWPQIETARAKLPSASVVYLATDSTELVAYVSQWQHQVQRQQNGLRVVFSNVVRDYWQQKPQYHINAATVGVIVDAWLLGESDWFVGTYTSAMSKAVQLLRHSRMGVLAEKSVTMPGWTNDNPGGFMTYMADRRREEL